MEFFSTHKHANGQLMRMEARCSCYLRIADSERAEVEHWVLFYLPPFVST